MSSNICLLLPKSLSSFAVRGSRQSASSRAHFSHLKSFPLFSPLVPSLILHSRLSANLLICSALYQSEDFCYNNLTCSNCPFLICSKRCCLSRSSQTLFSALLLSSSSPRRLFAITNISKRIFPTWASRGSSSPSSYSSLAYSLLVYPPLTDIDNTKQDWDSTLFLGDRFFLAFSKLTWVCPSISSSELIIVSRIL